MDVSRLAGQEATVLGGGSVGGYVAYFLAAARLVLNIVDFKSVRPKHTRGGRTIYESSQVGPKKVYAAKEKIERDYPGTVVHPYPFNVLEIPDIELRRMLRMSSVLIIAIDDSEAILRVNDLGYWLVEMVQVAMHARAMSGHVAISVPYVTPCLRCSLDVTAPTDIRSLDAEPGSGWHIRHVAHQAATMAIDIMYSKVTGQPITTWDISKNVIYIANTRDEFSPDGPGMRFEGSQKRPGCPVCASQ